MKKAVLSLFLFCAAVGIQAQTDRDACWLNAATGAWEWGFFKDFAVHDARQWQYASVKEGRKKTTITLRSGKETLQLEIRYQNDSVCTIAVKERYRPTGCGTARKASFPTCRLTQPRPDLANSTKTASC